MLGEVTLPLSFFARVFLKSRLWRVLTAREADRKTLKLFPS